MSLEVFAFILEELEKRFPAGWLIAPRGEGRGHGEVIAILVSLGCMQVDDSNPTPVCPHCWRFTACPH